MARHEFSIGSDLAGAAASALAATTTDSMGQQPMKKQKLKHKTQGLGGLGGALDVVGGALLEEVRMIMMMIMMSDYDDNDEG